MTHFGPYSRREWRAGGILFGSYLLFAVVSYSLLSPLNIHPEFALGMAGLFLAGCRLWPLVLLAAIAAAGANGAPFQFLIAEAVAATVQAAAGAYLLRRWRVDPIFRRDRDALYLIAALVLVAFSWPAIQTVMALFAHAPYTADLFARAYVADLFPLFIVTPLLMRWLGKVDFDRTLPEIVEIVAIFAILIFVDDLIFIRHVAMPYGINSVYLAIVPLLYIALRLRPRFVTLAFLVTAIIALVGLDHSPDPVEAFKVELLVLALTIVFFIITTLEENRRVSENQLLAQVASLRNAASRLASQSQAKNDFIAILAHELRNPLSPIVSGIDMLKLRGSGYSKDRSTLESMETAVTTIRRLIDDLLDTSRIAEGKFKLEQERFELAPVLRSAIASTEYHRRERHQNLAQDIPREPLVMYGDRVRIEQIFSNLLTNASKYSNEGDTVRLIARADGRFVEVTGTPNLRAVF